MKRILLLAFVAMAFASCGLFKETQQTPPTVRKDVEAAEGILTIHPLITAITTKKGEHRFILEAKSKTLYMTTDTETYDKIEKHLPLELVPGNIVVMQGTIINPLTFFTKEEFEELNSEFAKLGLQLNEYKIARLMNAATTTWDEWKRHLEAIGGKTSGNNTKPTPSYTRPKS